MWGHFKKTSFLGGRNMGGVGYNRTMESPGGVPRHVLLKNTCQDTFRKTLRGLTVISGKLQFRPSGMVPLGPIWSFV